MLADNVVKIQMDNECKLSKYLVKLEKGNKDLTHPYVDECKSHIDKKSLVDAGVRLCGSKLVYPLRTIENTILQVQAISSSTDNKGKYKRFLHGTTDQMPVFQVFGDQGIENSLNIIYAESMSKAAAIYESVKSEGNYVVLNCVNNSGLAKVSTQVSKTYPKKTHIICADNDKHAIHKEHSHVNEFGYDQQVFNSALNNNIPICMPISDFKDWDDWLGAGIGASDEIFDCISKAKPPKTAEICKDLELFKRRLKAREIKVSFPFCLSEKGVTITVGKDDKEVTKIICTKPLWVEAITRDHNSEAFGKLICWFDVDNKYHQLAIPAKILFGQGSEVAMLLADGGLPLHYNVHNKLLEYITTINPANRLKAAESTGWLDTAFVLPTQTINEPLGESIVFQPQGLSDVAKAIHKNGSFEDWKAGIVDAPEIMIFAICASLSAPVRFPLNIESGGFNFCGETSIGKTTLLQSAASVWGCGADPSQSGGKSVYIQKFNTTDNALEAKAAIFNDLALIIDEVGESNPKSLGQLIYRLMSGQGKSRSGRNGNLRDSKSWRVLIFAAGELPITEYIEQAGGNAKGGQIVRMPDIPVDKIFESASEADNYKKLFTDHYGFAGVEFLTKCTDLVTGFDLLKPEIIGEALTSSSQRVRKRFLVALHSGYLAIEKGVLPWSREKVLNAVKFAYKKWYSQPNSINEADKGISNIRNYLMRFGSSKFAQGHYEPNDRSGWFKDDTYFFAPDVFKEACNGANPTAVKKELFKLGFLHKNKPNTYNSNFFAQGKAVSTIAIYSTLLENTGNRGNEGNK